MELSKQISEEQTSTARNPPHKKGSKAQPANLAAIAYSLEQSPNPVNESKKPKSNFEEGTISQGA